MSKKKRSSDAKTVTLTELSPGDGTIDPAETLSRWRLESLQRQEASADQKPMPAGQWSDDKSCWFEGLLNSQGIHPPWGYCEEFGDRAFKVTGLRAGGSGVVFFVEFSGQGRKYLYAAKTLKSFLKSDYLNLSLPVQEEISRIFLEESLPWLELGQHPHIVSVHRLKNITHPISMRNVPFIFSEFLPRGNLRRYIRQNGLLPVRECLTLGIQICDGLLHAYRHSIKAHLDIKPENIMVYDDSIFKLTDFSADVIGTPLYMAPEQIANLWENRRNRIIPETPPRDHRADQFALGLVILESLLGHHPFSICQHTFRDVDQAKRYLSDGVGMITADSLDADFKSILERTFSPSVDERYPDLSFLRMELLRKYEKEFGLYEIPEVAEDDSPEWWFRRGEAFYTLGRPAQAEVPFREALGRFRTEQSSAAEKANCMMQLGIIFRDTGRLSEAENAYEEALGIYPRVPGTDLDQARCMMNLGVIYRDTARYSEAENTYKKALEIFHRNPRTELDQANCTQSLAGVYYKTGRLPKAEKAFEEAMEIFRQIPGTELQQSRCKRNLGSVYYDAGRYAEAEKANREALRECRPIPGTEFDKAICLMNLGLVFNATGRFLEAEESIQEALSIFQGFPGMELHQAECSMDLSAVHYACGHFLKAEKAVKASLEIFRGIPGTERDQAVCAMNLGAIHHSNKRFPEAEKAYKEAFRIYQDISGVEREQANCVKNLGSLYDDTQRFSEAEETLNKALQMYRETPESGLLQAQCLECIGTLYRHTKQYWKAEKTYREALSLYQEFPGTEIFRGKCKAELARCYQLMGDKHRSRNTAEEALKLCEPFPQDSTEEIRTTCQKILKGRDED
jgi:tetratricopeptide (TPR) repeat protein